MADQSDPMINFKGKKMRYSAFLKLKRKDCFIVDLPYGGEMMAIESDELRRGMEMLNLPFTDDMVNYGDNKKPKEKKKEPEDPVMQEWIKGMCTELMDSGKLVDEEKLEKPTPEHLERLRRLRNKFKIEETAAEMEKVSPRLAELFRERHEEVQTECWYSAVCTLMGFTKDRIKTMKKNPKIVDIMSGCGKRTALKFGFLYLVENGKKNPKVETKEFQMVLGEEVISRIMKNRCDSIETEIFENMIASLEENTYSNPSERAFMKKKIQEYKQMLEKKDPLVTYHGGKTRYSKLDLQKCSVEQKPSGEYVATDLDPKEIAKAEKKKEQNRKKRERSRR